MGPAGSDVLIRLAATLALLAGAAAAAAQDWSEPLYVKNLSPVTGLLGFPSQRSALTEPAGRLGAALHASVANTFVNDGSGDEYVHLDGETLRFDLELRYGLAEDWDLQVDLPWLEQSGGHLDRVIDDWHDLWGMPDGGRSDVPRDQLNYRYASPDHGFYLGNSDSGIGDVSAALSWAFYRDRGSAASLVLGYKFGTGDEDGFLGSGADDFFAGLRFSGADLSGRPLYWHGQAGYLRAGESDLLEGIQERNLWYAGLALDWAFAARWSLLLQLDGNAAPTDSDITALGDNAATFSFGARWRFAPGWSADLSLVEDILVETAADVVFQASLRYRGE